jgi:CheY-like chemotaxis protein
MSNSKMLKMLLSKKNVLCDLAFNGQEAVDAVVAKGDLSHYQVIFMDCAMPIKVGTYCTARSM